LTEVAAKKPPLSQRLKELLAEYGSIALVTYLVLFGIVFASFLVGIFAGADSGDSAGGIAGTLGAAWVATKITQPFRIAGTLALTPLVAALIHRRGDRDSDDELDEIGADEEE
jgi:hypothetical protein